MSELIIACVRTDEHVPFDCVVTLRNRVERYLPRPYTMTCLTDQPERCSGVAFVDVSAMELRSWCVKLALFEPQWRGNAKVVYLDLGVGIVGDLTPLVDVPGEFSILENPVRRISSPCKYDLSVMVIGGGCCGFVWEKFERHRDKLVLSHGHFGDKAVIESLYPSAPSLQRLLPKAFFKYRVLLRD